MNNALKMRLLMKKLNFDLQENNKWIEQDKNVIHTNRTVF